MYAEVRSLEWLMFTYNFTYSAPPAPDDPRVPHGEAFETALDPARFPDDRVSTTPGSVWDVIGHFDDLAASTCRIESQLEDEGGYRRLFDQEATIIRGCRATFVITDLVSVDSP